MYEEQCDFNERDSSEITKSFRKCNKALTNIKIYTISNTTNLFRKSIDYNSIVLITFVFFYLFVFSAERDIVKHPVNEWCFDEISTPTWWHYIQHHFVKNKYIK